MSFSRFMNSFENILKLPGYIGRIWTQGLGICISFPNVFMQIKRKFVMKLSESCTFCDVFWMSITVCTFEWWLLEGIRVSWPEEVFLGEQLPA